MNIFSQKGFSTTSLLLALVGASTTSMLIYKNSMQDMNEIQQSELLAKVNNAKEQRMSDFHRLSALLNPAAGKKPLIAASNYFATKWELKVDPDRSGQDLGFILKDKVIKLPHLSAGKNYQAIENIYAGSSSHKDVSSVGTSIVEVSRTEFDAGGTLATQLVLTSKSKLAGMDRVSSSSVAIPIRVPELNNVRLEVKPMGAADFTTNYGSASSPLPRGEIEFRVIVDGVALEASIEVVGFGSSRILGAGQQHEAISIYSKDAEVGRTVYDFNNDGTYEVTEATEETMLEFDSGTCKASAANGDEALTSGSYQVNVRAFDAEGKVHYPEIAQTIELFVEVDPHSNMEGVCPDSCVDLPQGIQGQTAAEWMEKGNYSKPAFNPHWLKKYSDVVSNVRLCKRYGNTREDDFIVYFSEPVCQERQLFQRNDCGCFAEETMILMADGQEKRITELRDGDFVWNPVLNRPVEIAYLIKGPEKFPLFRIASNDLEVDVTQNHPFPTPDGIKAASELKVGDGIYVGNNKLEIINKIETIPAQEDNLPVVWNFTLKAGSDPREHYLVANGIVTGDLFVQQQLEQGVYSTPDSTYNTERQQNALELKK